jgi:hypothetical protein
MIASRSLRDASFSSLSLSPDAKVLLIGGASQAVNPVAGYNAE